LLILISGTLPVGAASAFATPAFQSQWQDGEAITPNFWGPLASAGPGQQEPYQQAPGGERLVQYFDKGRMELTNPSTGSVTNGLLATEIVKGQVQLGDASFQPRPPPAIPIAGDPDNPSPTYAQLSSSAARLLAPVGVQPGAVTFQGIAANGTIVAVGFTSSGRADWGGYDDATRHNLVGVFVDYRNKVGLQTIGYAISEPFGATVKVAGQERKVLIQVFERRVLTYTASNPPRFQVEMGNIGAHYYQWRYGVSLASVQSATNSLPRSTR
jgi:hypothetical protein